MINDDMIVFMDTIQKFVKHGFVFSVEHNYDAYIAKCVSKDKTQPGLQSTLRRGSTINEAVEALDSYLKIFVHELKIVNHMSSPVAFESNSKK